MGMSWVANPGTEKRLKGPLEEVTERAVSQVTGAGVTQRSAVLELARLDFNTGIEILLKMEKGEGHFQQVTRSKKLARQMVHDLRALFASCQLIPDRDPGWVDHWALDTRKLENVARARMEEARRQESRALALSAQALQGQVSARNLISNLRDVAVGDAVIPDLAAVPRGPAGQFMPVGRVPAGYVDQLGGGGAPRPDGRTRPCQLQRQENSKPSRGMSERRERARFWPSLRTDQDLPSGFLVTRFNLIYAKCWTPGGQPGLIVPTYRLSWRFLPLAGEPRCSLALTADLWTTRCSGMEATSLWKAAARGLALVRCARCVSSAKKRRPGSAMRTGSRRCRPTGSLLSPGSAVIPGGGGPCWTTTHPPTRR